MIISRGSRGILSTKVTVLLRHSCRLQVIVSKEETPARATRLISCRRGPKDPKTHFRSRADLHGSVPESGYPRAVLLRRLQLLAA
jgi:hypothetical protein